MQRQEIRQQTAVEQVNRQHAAGRISAADVFIAGGEVIGANVAALAERFDNEFADGGGIAQTKIEPLRADRREYVGRLADERDPAGAKAAGSLGPQGE